MSVDSLKVILVGDAHTGKTSIINQYINEEFSLNYIMTVGNDKSLKTVKIENKEINLTIWDTCGQEQYSGVNQIFLKKSNIAILVYDLTDRKTFDNLDKWYNEIKAHNNIDDIIVGIAANKCDLYINEEVNLDEAKNYCETIQGSIFETTATNYNSVNLLFQTLAEKYYEKFLKEKKSNNIKITSSTSLSLQNDQKITGKGQCCEGKKKNKELNKNNVEKEKNENVNEENNKNN